jgi:GxxExxY protein
MRHAQGDVMPDAGDRDPRSFAVIGAAIDVHRTLGCGFLEAVYRSALAIELRRRRVEFTREVSFELSYAGEPLHLSFRADFVCCSTLIVEVKALNSLGPLELAQTINYLKASGLQRGLIINFGQPRLEWRRVALTHGWRTAGTGV